MGTALTRLTSAGIVRRIRDAEVSPVDVVEAHLERIHARNDRTNAFLTVTEDFALEQAAAAERAVENGDVLGPLHGVPVAIKDIRDVEGVPTTRGSLLFEDHVAEADAPFVARLKAAGAIVVGKTNTPEFGLGTTTENRLCGPTGTPFDPDCVAGGSSGGSGAAVADSLVPLAMGTDEGGSIRIPASLCGVYGIKPTFGVVPIATRPNAFGVHTPFSHNGPLTRSVEDAALSLDVMAGQHASDPFSAPTNSSFQSAVDRPIDDLTVAYDPGLGIYPVDPGVRGVIDDAVDGLREAGVTVHEIDLDLGYELDEILDAYYTMVMVRWHGLLAELEARGHDPYGEDRDRLRPYLVDLILDAEEPSIHDYNRANRVRTTVFDRLGECFDRYDLFVSATTSTTAFPHGEEPTEIDGVEIEPLRGWVLTHPYNFTGHPVASIPVGFLDGLPVGMQIAGRRHRDVDVIAASAAIERRRPWQDRYPH